MSGEAERQQQSADGQGVCQAVMMLLSGRQDRTGGLSDDEGMASETGSPSRLVALILCTVHMHLPHSRDRREVSGQPARFQRAARRWCDTASLPRPAGTTTGD